MASLAVSTRQIKCIYHWSPHTTAISNDRTNNIDATPKLMCLFWYSNIFLRTKNYILACSNCTLENFTLRVFQTMAWSCFYFPSSCQHTSTQLIRIRSLFYDLCLTGTCIGKRDKAINFLIGHILNDITLNSESVFSLWITMPFSK